ncbi:hypothetical protein OJAV_G00076260 [Oryzias javanicus]|uniref:Uncharacterized protein n=1 Tax=Oryzias javanicus TaxID=123683 RepID=A0A437D3Q1_ORYJA|nr:hypothetical protein OJAV_G00076260 [Oryzias javanicus]
MFVCPTCDFRNVSKFAEIWNWKLLPPKKLKHLNGEITHRGKISGWKRETESVKRKQVKKILDWTIVPERTRGGNSIITQPRTPLYPFPIHKYTHVKFPAMQKPKSLTSHLVNLGTKGQSYFTEPGDTLLPSQEPHLPVALKGMAPIRDSVSHSPNQTGLDHPGLDSQYEPSPWSSGSPCSSDSSSNWGKVLVDGNTDKSNNPCSASSSVWPPSSSSFSCSSSSSSSGCGSGSDPELASECTDADSSSSIRLR